MECIDEQGIKQQRINRNTFAVYIYTTMCGTCHIAKKMLTVIEALNVSPIYEINGNFCEEYLQENKIQSVPSLVLYKNGKHVETIFAFGDVIYLKNKFSQLE